MSTNPFLPLYGAVYGSLYFAVVLSTAFYGITCMQTFFYYVHYQSDHLRMKGFVTTLWALNTIHEALIIAGAYKYFMNGWVNPSSFLFANPELALQLLLTALVAVPTQGFFVHRLYVFSGRKIVVPLIWAVLAVIQIVFATIYVAKALYSNANGVQILSAVELLTSSFTNLATVCLSVAAGVDVMIAIFLTFLLLRKRAATPFASTADILQRLIIFAVNTAIWPAAFALLTTILENAFSFNLLYAVFGVPLCPVYCNTLLANLNARSYVRGEATTHNIDVDLFSNSSSPASGSVGSDKRHGEAQILPPTHQRVWRATEVVTFPEANRSQTSQNVSV